MHLRMLMKSPTSMLHLEFNCKLKTKRGEGEAVEKA